MTRRDCVLAYIEARPGSDDAEIADALLLEPFEVSLIVRDLRREGLIETDS